MRFALPLLIGFILACPISVDAATLRPSSTDTEMSSNIVDVAGPRCGRYHHYVRGHHARDGRWIRGHCVRNRRH